MKKIEDGPSMLRVLSLIHTEPTLYLDGAKEGDFSKQLDCLENILSGYALAVYHHRLHDEGFDVYAGFLGWLKKRFHYEECKSEIQLIRRAFSDDKAAWYYYWALLWEYFDQVQEEDKILNL